VGWLALLFCLSLLQAKPPQHLQDCNIANKNWFVATTQTSRKHSRVDNQSKNLSRSLFQYFSKGKMCWRGAGSMHDDVDWHSIFADSQTQTLIFQMILCHLPMEIKERPGYSTCQNTVHLYHKCSSEYHDGAQRMLAHDQRQENRRSASRYRLTRIFRIFHFTNALTRGKWSSWKRNSQQHVSHRQVVGIRCWEVNQTKPCIPAQIAAKDDDFWKASVHQNRLTPSLPFFL